MKPFESSLLRARRPRGVPAPVAIAVAVLVTAALANCSNGSAATHEAAPAAAAAPAVGSGHPPIEFSGGAPSVDALLAEFMTAVEQRDLESLHRLRVTENEYQQIIVPGFVPVGHAPREISEKPREFFWSLSDTKSRYFAHELVDRFGGRHYVERRLTFTKGSKAYAWYTAHGEVELMLRTADDPDPFRLRTGTIAELDGRFKFISFEWDD